MSRQHPPRDAYRKLPAPVDVDATITSTDVRPVADEDDVRNTDQYLALLTP